MVLLYIFSIDLLRHCILSIGLDCNRYDLDLKLRLLRTQTQSCRKVPNQLTAAALRFLPFCRKHFRPLLLSLQVAVVGLYDSFVEQRWLRQSVLVRP